MYFEERQYEYAKLSLAAFAVTQDMRRNSKFPRRT